MRNSLNHPLFPSPRRRRTRGIAALLAAALALSFLTTKTHAQGTPQPEPPTQKRFGVGWIQNYITLPYTAATAAIRELRGFLASAPGEEDAPGWLERNTSSRGNPGLFSPEVVAYYKQWLPFLSFTVPSDIIRREFPTTPQFAPTDVVASPYLSNAKTRKGVNSWYDFLADVGHNNTHYQSFLVTDTLLARYDAQLNALEQHLRDGDGRFGSIASTGQRGIGGQDLGGYEIPPGDTKAAVESAARAAYDVAQLQEPSVAADSAPEAPLPAQFVHSPTPTRSGAIPGGSTASRDVAKLLGLLPGTTPFLPFTTIRPPDFVSPVTNQINQIIQTFGDIPNALNIFGGPQQLGNLGNLFGAGRVQDLLGQGGGPTENPGTTDAPEDPQCAEDGAQRSRETVENAARLLQLPAENPWTVALRPAARLYGVAGLNPETGREVTIGESLFPPEMCVWVVASGATDAVFVSDSAPVVFRLTNIAP